MKMIAYLLYLKVQLENIYIQTTVQDGQLIQSKSAKITNSNIKEGFLVDAIGF